MTWFFALLAVLLLGLTAVVAAGAGDPMSPATRDRRPPQVPEHGRLTGPDLRRVRFPLALRGYRMADVDRLLDRVAAQLEEEPPRDSGGPPVGR